jgi:hypothetical protein
VPAAILIGMSERMFVRCYTAGVGPMPTHALKKAAHGGRFVSI